MKKATRYRWEAAIVTAIHVGWTILLFGGAIFVFFAPWYAPFQIVTIAITLLIPIPFGMVCPLTRLEEWLRQKNDPTYTNHGSYLMTYVNKVCGTDISRRSIDIFIGVLYFLSVSASIYLLVRG